MHASKRCGPFLIPFTREGRQAEDEDRLAGGAEITAELDPRIDLRVVLVARRASAPYWQLFALHRLELDVPLSGRELPAWRHVLRLDNALDRHVAEVIDEQRQLDLFVCRYNVVIFQCPRLGFDLLRRRLRHTQLQNDRRRTAGAIGGECGLIE